MWFLQQLFKICHYSRTNNYLPPHLYSAASSLSYIYSSTSPPISPMLLSPSSSSPLQKHSHMASILYCQYGNFAEKIFHLWRATTQPQRTILLPQGVNNINCAVLVKAKVSTDMITVLLYFKLSLIKGSGGGPSYWAVRETQLISLRLLGGTSCSGCKVTSYTPTQAQWKGTLVILRKMILLNVTA